GSIFLFCILQIYPHLDNNPAVLLKIKSPHILLMDIENDTLPQLGQGHQESVQTSSIKLKEAVSRISSIHVSFLTIGCLQGSSHAIENSAPPLYPNILKISRDPGLHIPLKRKRDDFCYEQDPDSGLTRPDVVLFPLTSLLEPPDDESEEDIDLAIVTSGATPPQGARPLSFNGLKSPSATPREPVSSALGSPETCLCLKSIRRHCRHWKLPWRPVMPRWDPCTIAGSQITYMPYRSGLPTSSPDIVTRIQSRPVLPMMSPPEHQRLPWRNS
ncbi:unnamed protein product, partial [Mycena citricolor]